MADQARGPSPGISPCCRAWLGKGRGARLACVAWRIAADRSDQDYRTGRIGVGSPNRNRRSGRRPPSPCHAGHRRVIGGVWPRVDRRSSSYHFFAPHKQLTSSSARNLGLGTREHLHHATRNRSQSNSERAEHPECRRAPGPKTRSPDKNRRTELLNQLPPP